MITVHGGPVVIILVAQVQVVSMMLPLMLMMTVAVVTMLERRPRKGGQHDGSKYEMDDHRHKDSSSIHVPGFVREIEKSGD